MKRTPFTYIVAVLTIFTIVISVPVVHAATTTSLLGGGVTINEILVDPNGASNFDTDGNGTANAEDEFVELYNTAGQNVDISGWELWDAGSHLWFSFAGSPDSGTVVLAPDAYAVVVGGVQAGGSLPTMTDPNSIARDAGRSSGAVNNGGDNVVLYDPGANEFIQIRYNGDPADDPPADYSGFSSSASRVGPVENWGTDQDGKSITRYPSGDEDVGVHQNVVPGGDNASPTAITVRSIQTNGTFGIPPVALMLISVLVGVILSVRQHLPLTGK